MESVHVTQTGWDQTVAWQHARITVQVHSTESVWL